LVASDSVGSASDVLQSPAARRGGRPPHALRHRYRAAGWLARGCGYHSQCTTQHKSSNHVLLQSANPTIKATIQPTQQ